MPARVTSAPLDPSFEGPGPQRESGIPLTGTDEREKESEDFTRGREQPKPPPVRRGPDWPLHRDA